MTKQEIIMDEVKGVEVEATFSLEEYIPINDILKRKKDKVIFWDINFIKEKKVKLHFTFEGKYYIKFTIIYKELKDEEIIRIFEIFRNLEEAIQKKEDNEINNISIAKSFVKCLDATTFDFLDHYINLIKTK